MAKTNKKESMSEVTLDLSYLKRDIDQHRRSTKIKSKSKTPARSRSRSRSRSKTKSNADQSMKKGLKGQYMDIVNNPSKYPHAAKWIAAKKASGVKYICYLGSTGYADAAKGYIRSLVEIGLYVWVEPIRYCDQKSLDLLTLDDQVLAVCLHNKHIKYDHVIIHAIPNEWPPIIERERKYNPYVKIYGLTVWETDRVDSTWIKIIDSYQLNGLIVPSQWNRETFITTAQNLRVHSFPPVLVCHHAIIESSERNTSLSSKSVAQSKPLNRQTLYGPNAKLTLLCIGTWTCRKGIDESIHAYLTAFKGYQDVVMYLKTSDGPYTPENDQKLINRLNHIYHHYDQSTRPKIILDTQLRSDQYIDQLIQHSDVYLSLCNSEGVGLGACQSALKGKIIVMTGYGGQKEYIKEGNWIQYQMGTVKTPPNFAEWIHPPQQWAYPSIEHAVKVLRDIYQHPENYLNKAQQNRQFILDQFNYQSRGTCLKDLLQLPDSISRSKV